MRSLAGAVLVLPVLVGCGSPAEPDGLPASLVSQDPPAIEQAGRSLPPAGEWPRFQVALSVDAAYRAIPHRRTPFDFESSDLAPGDRAYLELAFHAIDQGIALRVATLQRFLRGDLSGDGLPDKLDGLILFWRSVDPPRPFGRYHQLIDAALVDQRAFFSEWEVAGPSFANGQPQTLGAHPKVRSSSSALHQAYALLKKRYRAESPSNKDALFDYHCALDFI